MSCKTSIIYSANTSTQTLAENTATTVNFGSIVRRCGDALTMSGGNVVLSEVGFYSIDINIGATVGAGNVTVQLYKDGTLIPGATATITSGAAATSIQAVIPCTIRSRCCCDSTITCIATSTVAGAITSASIRVVEDEED